VAAAMTIVVFALWSGRGNGGVVVVVVVVRMMVALMVDGTIRWSSGADRVGRGVDGTCFGILLVIGGGGERVRVIGGNKTINSVVNGVREQLVSNAKFACCMLFVGEDRRKQLARLESRGDGSDRQRCAGLKQNQL
jgi:hypothetical protein